MQATDFPAWYSAGIFGGIGCALLSAVTIATWSLWRRRGVTGQVIGALLVCVVASALDIGPLLWIEYRLNVYGPTLGVGEVAAALAVAALVGWAAPLATMCWYVLLAPPSASTPGRAARFGAVSPAALDDPGRARAVVSGGGPWALLAPVEATPEEAPGRPIALTQELTLIGRELDNDIVLDDDRVSRRHAELRWDHGRVELTDYGSLNGTLINQQAARGRLLLRDGDLIEFGKHRYRFEMQAGESSAAVPADKSAQASVETRKTASISGSFALGHSLLRLVLIQGAAIGVSGSGAVWPLGGAVITIGRDSTCGVSLSDTAISRVHAQITRQPAGYFIADLQSSNGVFLNGERLTAPTQIFAGDIIALGDCLLRCEENTSETSSASPASATPPVAIAEQYAQASAAPTIALSPTGAPSFHMRISPEWAAPHVSRPRLAPPRLTPTPRQDDTPATS